MFVEQGECSLLISVQLGGHLGAGAPCVILDRRRQPRHEGDVDQARAQPSGGIGEPNASADLAAFSVMRALLRAAER